MMKMSPCNTSFDHHHDVCIPRPRIF